MQLATMRGKEAAVAALKGRRLANAKTEQINNANLVAGSPMHYYCIACGSITDVLPECHLNMPRRLCRECQAMKELGWLE